jgi:hypothetical protein
MEYILIIAAFLVGGAFGCLVIGLVKSGVYDRITELESELAEWESKHENK